MKKILTVLCVVMALAMSVSAFAATVAPQANVDMSAELTDGIFSAEFTTADIDGESLMAIVYDTFNYDIVEVNQLAAGDVITCSKGDITVETVENDDAGYVQINGGQDEENGVTLMPVDEDNTYYEMDYELYAMAPVGQAQFALADEVTVNVYKMTEDGSPAGEGYDTTTCAKADLADTLNAIELFGGEFSPYQTKITVDNGALTEITIDYMP